MASNKLLLRITLWTTLIGLSVVLGALAWSLRPHSLVIVLVGLLLGLEVLLFTRDINRLNRKIAAFMQALGNQDTAFQLPQESGNPITRELHGALNHVITSFQKVKMDYAAREQLYLAMMEHSSTGFISIDQHGDFEIMNQAARKLLGVRFTSNLSRLAKEMPELYELIEALAPGQQFSCKVKGPEGALVLQISSALMRYQGQEFTLLSLQNITHETDARELESWQKLIRIMNHEIMNSIAPITSASRSLKSIFLKADRALDPREVDQKKIADTLDGLDIIDSMSTGLKHFVENYRKLSRIPEPVRKSINMEKWAATLHTLGHEVAREGNASLEIQVLPGLHRLEADEGLLNQVLINLIRNATEAPSGQSPKHIRVELAPAFPDQDAAPTEQSTVIRVINNGEAIPPERCDSIFIPFYTSREDGAGIGLFLSRQIAIKHGGSLSTFTDTEGNTVFEMRL